MKTLLAREGNQGRSLLQLNRFYVGDEAAGTAREERRHDIEQTSPQPLMFKTGRG